MICYFNCVLYHFLCKIKQKLNHGCNVYFFNIILNANYSAVSERPAWQKNEFDSFLVSQKLLGYVTFRPTQYMYSLTR